MKTDNENIYLLIIIMRSIKVCRKQIYKKLYLIYCYGVGTSYFKYGYLRKLNLRKNIQLLEVWHFIFTNREMRYSFLGIRTVHAFQNPFVFQSLLFVKMLYKTKLHLPYACKSKTTIKSIFQNYHFSMKYWYLFYKFSFE